jgi:hypothetical protein
MTVQSLSQEQQRPYVHVVSGRPRAAAPGWHRPDRRYATASPLGQIPGVMKQAPSQLLMPSRVRADMTAGML